MRGVFILGDTYYDGSIIDICAKVGYGEAEATTAIIREACLERDFVFVHLNHYDAYMLVDAKKLIKTRLLFAKVPQCRFGEFIGGRGRNIEIIKRNINIAIEKMIVKMGMATWLDFTIILKPSFDFLGEEKDNVYLLEVPCGDEVEAKYNHRLVDEVCYQYESTHRKQGKTILSLYYVGKERAEEARAIIDPSNKLPIKLYK